MSEYAHMTRAQLIARLRRLERREETHQVLFQIQEPKRIRT
jgi:hypothetical protein